MKLVTALTPDFWPGLHTLAWSLKHYGKLTNMVWVVLWDGEPPSDAQDILKSYGFSPVFIPTHELGKPPLTPGRIEVLKWARHKLLIWKLPTDNYCFLDADLLCINDARELLTFKHFSVVPDGLAPKMYDADSPHMNTGLMVFRPTPELAEQIHNFRKDPRAPEKYILADQDFLSHYMLLNERAAIHYLPLEWNMIKRIYHKKKHAWDWDNIKFIHYVGNKPWQSLEPGYETLHHMWQRFYYQAGGPNVLNGA